MLNMLWLVFLGINLSEINGTLTGTTTGASADKEIKNLTYVATTLIVLAVVFLIVAIVSFAILLKELCSKTKIRDIQFSVTSDVLAI